MKKFVSEDWYKKKTIDLPSTFRIFRGILYIWAVYIDTSQVGHKQKIVVIHEYGLNKSYFVLFAVYNA